MDIDCKDFCDFVKNLKEKLNTNSKYYEQFLTLNKWSFEIWKATLKAKDYKLLKIIANDVIRHDTSSNLAISNKMWKDLNADFESVLNGWKYRKGDLIIKILFINLFSLSKDETGKLVNNVVHYVFDTAHLHLDHLDAQNPDPNCEYKYFRPQTPGIMRDDYTDGLGNMMILDSVDNEEKNNAPLSDSAKYYKKMHPSHWMVKELFQMLEDSKYKNEIPIGN